MVIGSAKESFWQVFFFSWDFLQKYYVLIMRFAIFLLENVLVVGREKRGQGWEGSKKAQAYFLNAVSDAIDRRSCAERKAGGFVIVFAVYTASRLPSLASFCIGC